jgi:hypothetical protein
MTTDQQERPEAPERTFCVQCGPGIVIDEDGCCATCGATATGKWADAACRAFDSLAEPAPDVREWPEIMRELADALEAEIGDQYDIRYPSERVLVRARALIAALPVPTEPLLGLATTRELIHELHARVEVAYLTEDAWPRYRTVDECVPTEPDSEWAAHDAVLSLADERRVRELEAEVARLRAALADSHTGEGT